MEVIVWHEDLGSDDDAASEEESLARILYYWPPRSTNEQLRVLQLLQGTYSFASTFSKQRPSSTLTHVQLTNMHYCFERVESKVWMAFGHNSAKDVDRYIMETLLRGMYSSFFLLHGGIASALDSVDPSKECPQVVLDAGLHTGMAILLELAACRKNIRRTTQLISKIQNDKDTETCATATADLSKLKAWADLLADVSPAYQLQRTLTAFFPVYLANLDVHNLTCLYDLDGICTAPVDCMLQMAGHLLAQSLHSEVPAVLHCASFLHGQLVCGGGWDPAQLELVYRFLRLREQQAMHVSKFRLPGSILPPWLRPPCPDSLKPIWASKQTYIDGDLQPFKKRTSAKDLLVDAIASTSSSAVSPSEVRGFQTTDGMFREDLGPDKLWRLPLFDRSCDGEATADLVVWHEAACTLILCVQPHAPSSGLIADVGWHLRQSVYVGAFHGAAPVGPHESSSAFVHLNRLTKQVHLHNVGNFKGPVPPRLVASCFHPRLLDELKYVRHDLASDDGIMDIFTKTASDGWIIVRRSGSLERELVAFVDAKAVDSIADLSNSMNTLIHTSFDKIFM
ncbi:hypothetical protein H310_00257 [Aphanomyces invadans]|uniref:CCZ1/INTU/HSP4 first Longin domain-containing protein n=1 Tax=Aphanomyces invadans TaxID=157072 RepID=A0A024UTD2_9STRA|nr:hypothetical protein H310_00257 [Aphanomyces invadans]ETW09776.1 hypothetical protein H310_00257 [Aphanomyces invadans]|eukprot:XP_008861187.1 hypothetical protein H310_00257 [Aphanomyces invadans]